MSVTQYYFFETPKIIILKITTNFFFAKNFLSLENFKKIILKRNIVLTKDGSTTLQIEHWNEHYHSTHGAIQEAFWVFIKHGLDCFKNQKISVLEIGLGTALNCFITFLEHEKRNLTVDYQGVEAYPVEVEQALSMNYVQQLNAEKFSEIFEKIHSAQWGKSFNLSETFSLTKRQQFFEQISDCQKFDLIYFDAFGARVQPELWTKSIFEKMYKSLKKDGILVTYSAKGSVRRAMLEVGFEVEKLSGPPGKREMLRAIKK